MGSQSSPDEDVVEEDVDHDVVAGVYLRTHLPAAAYYVFGVQRMAGLAAPTLGLGRFLRYQCFPLPKAEQIFLDLPDVLPGP